MSKATKSTTTINQEVAMKFVAEFYDKPTYGGSWTAYQAMRDTKPAITGFIKITMGQMVMDLGYFETIFNYLDDTWTVLPKEWKYSADKSWKADRIAANGLTLKQIGESITAWIDSHSVEIGKRAAGRKDQKIKATNKLVVNEMLKVEPATPGADQQPDGLGPQ